MFTGIITHRGYFRAFYDSRRRMAIEAPEEILQSGIGESIAVNGVCLSMTMREKNLAYFDLSEETLKQTALGSLKRKDVVNLELPLTLSTPLSGHLVSGHIDGTEKVLKILPRRGGKRCTFSLAKALHPYFIRKGSVAVDGVSLTVADLSPSSFDVEIIPITLENTNLSLLKRGDLVNVESDILGKYVYNWMFSKSIKKD